MKASTRKDTQRHAQVISQSYFASAAPRVFWSFVNRSRACLSPLPAINVDGSLIHDDLVKANTFISSVFTDEDISNLQELQCSSTSHPLLLDSINVSESAVFELLRDLACGLILFLSDF